MITAALLAGAFTCLALFVYYFLTRNTDYWKKRSVIGPEPKLFFGNLKEFILRKKNLNETINQFYNEYPEEKVVGLYRLTSPCLLVRDLDILQHIFIKDFDTFVHRGVDFSEKGLGLNLLHADGDSWRVLRTKLSPIFTSGKLRNMLHLIHECSDKFVNYADQVILKQSELNIYPLIQSYTMSSISACAFGIDMDYTENNFTKQLKKVDRTVFTNTRFVEVDYMFPGVLKMVNMDMLPALVRDFFKNIVDTIVTERNGVPSNRNDFMDLLLEIKNAGEIRTNKHDTNRVLQINEQILAAQAFIFYVAGYETSATTMSFLLHELSYHQDIQDKCVQEINDVIKKNGGVITYDSLKQMTYLKQVFDETLRMYPILDPLQRVNKVDYKIPGVDLVLEKGTIVLVPVRGIHYDEMIYPDPTKFDPERFSVENVKLRHPCAYLPFGAGPRNCIGMRFAHVQSTMCLAKLLPRWRVMPASTSRRHLEYDPNRPLLASVHGIPLKLERRQ